MFKKFIVRLILITFFFTSLGPLPDLSAQTLIDLPAPGMMVNTSNLYQPLALKGILVNAKNPLRFDFLVDKGNSKLSGQPLKDEIIRSAKYFLTCLAVPEDDLWVNLSPYEKDRIVPGNFGITLMGKDLLEQDYLLKQIMASLSYPENDLGKRFWQRVYHKSYELYGTTNIPISTFNKVWIIPKTAEVYVQGDAAFVVRSQLDVMLEADYKAIGHHQGISQKGGAYSQVFRDVILPELRQEINEGKNFAVVRQVYNAMILATWYKRNLKDSLLGKLYIGRNEVGGVDIEDKNTKEKIFQQYLKAYKKCVYNYIKEDFDPITQQNVPRKYASGGVDFKRFGVSGTGSIYKEVPNTMGMDVGTDLAMATVNVAAIGGDGAIVSIPDLRRMTENNPLHVEYNNIFPKNFSELVPNAVASGILSPGIQDAAMTSQKVRAFVRTAIVAVALMIGVNVAAPSAHAASFKSIDNGTRLQVTVGENDTFGQIVIDANKDANAGFVGPSLWGKYGTVSVVGKFVQPKIDLKHLHAGETFYMPTKKGLNLEPTEVINRVFDSHVPPVHSKISGVAAVLPTVSATQASQKPLSTLAPSGNSIAKPISNAQAPLNRPAPHIDTSAATISSGVRHVAAGSPPPPPEDKYSKIIDDLRSELVLCVGLAILGMGGKAILKKRNKFRKFTKTSTDNESISPLEPPTANARELIDAALPPSPALPVEKKMLADDLAKLQALAKGVILPNPPVMAEEDNQSGGQNLRWMDAGALLGGLGLSLYFGGGVSWMVLMSPLITRGLYVAQKWLHEILHLGTASVLYPTKIGATWSSRNIRGNLSLGQWAKSLIPFTPVHRSYVDLPFAKAKGNGWNISRNQMIAKTGLIGSTALVFFAGHFMGATPLLAPLVISALAVIKGSIDSGDLRGSHDTDEGKFGCGIIGFIKRVPLQGVKTKDMKPWLAWFFKGMETSSARGGQQAGVSTNFSGPNGTVEQLDEKITKQKRSWIPLQNWDKGPVFFRNMVDDLYVHFYKELPGQLVPIYNYAKSGVLKFVGHMRFATGGDMVEAAAHPFSSPREEREQWFYDAQNMARKVIRIFNVTSAFNGDHNGSKLGVPNRIHLFNSLLGFTQMRRFFAAAVHSYYQGRVTEAYLKKTVNNGSKYEPKVNINYRDVVRALHKKGYVTFSGYVSRRFINLDEEFKSWFPKYNQKIFDEIESALFGMPPGDAPIIPLVQHLYLTQGNWFASLRYAHVMTNHHNLQEATDDILFEEEGLAVGDIFSEVYDQVQPYLARRGYTPENTEKVRSLSDLFVKDEETARSLGLEDQHQMIEIFKDMLDQRMQAEAKKDTLAGMVFKQWEEKWKRQGMKADDMRRLTINVAVEKFFTADSIAATKEFAERSEGTYGVFMQNPLDDSITLYQDNQDVVIGYNEEAGVIAFGSDPRALKVVGPNGEKVEKVMHLKEGEVVNVSFSPSGKTVVRSWTRSKGKWVESTSEELEERTYPTMEYVDGVKNPYYASPPVQYNNPRRIVQEDLQNIPKILARAQAELDDPDSFNSQSTEYLGERISDVISKNGHARLVYIAYDNSREISEQGKTIIEDLIESSKLSIDVIDANEFNETPSKYNIKPDDIVVFVSKSGATFSTKLALRIVQALKVNPENIFCMSARIDSVLNTMIGQGLRPGKDNFTKRVFITGEFYPSETPVASEVLLEFQMQQLALNLARVLGRRNADPQKTIGLKFSADRLEQLAEEITKHSIRMAKELTGFDIDGTEYANTDKEAKTIGTYLGKAALETFVVKWFMNLFVGGVLVTPALLLGPHPMASYLGVPVGVLLGMWATLNVFWINSVVPFWAIGRYRKIIGRSPYGEAPFNLLIAAPPQIFSTQRNFFSRILTNRLKSISPAGIYGGDPKGDFVANFASDVGNGDIILKISLNEAEGKMGPSQTAFPSTGVFGTKILKSKAEIREFVVKVPMEEMGITKSEENFINNTLGTLGLMIAAKKIGVEMAKVASFDGRLFNLATTFSSAGVHTTQINPINEEVRSILYAGREQIEPKKDDTNNQEANVEEHDAAQISSKGGIDMSSRLMLLNITGEAQPRIGGNDYGMSVSTITGVVPQVSGIVTVTPDMLKAMLGQGFLN